MALGITVRAVSVSEPMPGLLNVTLNLICTDPDQAGAEVINRNFTQPRKAAVSIPTVQERFRAEMQECIDQYLREQVLFTHAALGSAVADIQAALVGE